MKIRNIQLDDNELPETVTVEMTIGEAAFIAKVCGGLSRNTAIEQHGPIGAHHDDIYDSLTGGLFNRFWEDGIDDALRVIL